MATMFKSDLPKRVRVKNRTVSKARKTRYSQNQIERRRAYELVDQRDHGVCRYCTNRGGDRHHLTFRSHGGPHTTANLVTLCRSCHDLVHRRRLHIEGNADETLTFTRTS